MVNNIIKSISLTVLLLLPAVSQARSVKELSIQNSGQTLQQVSNTDEINVCKKFKPTQKQVINYFNHAYPVEAHFVISERYSSCYAEGKLTFSDGAFGTWRLYSSGGSTFVFNRGDTVSLFYAYNKWHDPYAGTYDSKTE